MKSELKWKSLSYVRLCYPHGLYNPLNSPGQNTGMGSLSLLQGIFPTQGWNPGLPHCRQILNQLSHKGSPRILEWVAHPFSSGSSDPGIKLGVYYTAGRFFTNWVIREANGGNSLDSEILQAKSLQSCPTLCNPMDRMALGPSVHGIL